MSLLLSLVLSAAVLDPHPKDARRLQPRQITASSFLANGWNRAEQNYLPPYAADDDAATAWVEGVPGFGEGQSLTWLGPTLQHVKQLRIFIRNGYQKTRALYSANGRPKRIQLQPLLKSEVTEVAAGRPVTVTLSDELGWQEVVLPTDPHVTGFRLTLLSVYPGAKFQDTAISDVRVYVEGGDAYNLAAELSAMEAIRQFVAERQRAAALQGDEGSIELAPSYRVEALRASGASTPDADDDESEGDFSELAKAHQGDVFKQRWRQIWALAQAMDATKPFAERAFQEVTTDAPKGWTRVTARPRHAKASAAAVALAQSPDRDMAWAVAYLASKDVLLFQDTATPARLNQRVEAARRQEKADKAWCRKSAAAAARAQNAAPLQDSEYLAQQFYMDHESRCEQLIAMDPSPAPKSAEVAAEIHGGSFVKGGFEHPSQLLILHAFYLSDRNFLGQSMTRMLVAYEGNLASVVATADLGEGVDDDAPFGFIHVLEWKDLGNGRHKLIGITTVSPQGAWRLTAVD